MKFVCLNCETYMGFEKVEKPAEGIARRLLRLPVVRGQVFHGDQPRRNSDGQFSRRETRWPYGGR